MIRYRSDTRIIRGAYCSDCVLYESSPVEVQASDW